MDTDHTVANQIAVRAIISLGKQGKTQPMEYYMHM